MSRIIPSTESITFYRDLSDSDVAWPDLKHGQLVQLYTLGEGEPIGWFRVVRSTEVDGTRVIEFNAEPVWP